MFARAPYPPSEAAILRDAASDSEGQDVEVGQVTIDGAGFSERRRRLGRKAAAAAVSLAVAASLAAAALAAARPRPRQGVALASLEAKLQIRRRPATLVPSEDRQDGNQCDDSEELYDGLCYTQCKILTDGTHPFRSTAFSCCKTKDCGLTDVAKMKVASVLPCEGYDVSSSDDGKACPHGVGVCLKDEDQWGDRCYEKCSILTHGKYTNRVAPATCCKTEGAACLNPFNDDTSASFDVGGGKGDGSKATPAGPHFPLKSLTEGASSKVNKAKKAKILDVASLRRRPLNITPSENRNDSNVCDDTEELHDGLCYTQCKILTHGSHPFRSTAFSCCKTKDCSLDDVAKMKVASVLPCEGYDVSSSDGGKACPHGAGVCLEDEDQWGDRCYEKCSILTQGKYTNRVAPATCCKTEGAACLNPFNDDTSASFDVGGGKGDGSKATPAGPHLPLKSLTEEAKVKATTTDVTNKRRRPLNITPPENREKDCSGLGAVSKLKVASVLPCEGYDVSSSDDGKACPHGPGVCLEEEDQWGDRCYEKCSILTHGKYTNRVAPATCCKTEGAACLNPFNDDTSAGFDIGGGKGDGNKATPAGPHFPLKPLTDA